MSKFTIPEGLLNVIKDSEDHIIERQKRIAKTNAINLTSNNEVFIPEIFPNDNILVRIVKEILREKNVSLKELAFKDPRELNNYKGSLKNHNKMSIEKFSRWMELLDYEWSLNYEPKSDEE